MGGDFTYQAAEMFYINMDRLIAGFRRYRSDINIIYSTPSCYVKAVNEASAKLSYPLKTDDFFPYASGPHSYWTGYFTSRPNSKRFERQGNNFLQVMKQLATLSKTTSEHLDWLKETMGIMQHHDAITGTEKQHVTDDYVRLLTKAIQRAHGDVNLIIPQFLDENSENQLMFFYESCILSNVSYCRSTFYNNTNEFTLAVYNPLSRKVVHYVHVPVIGTQFNIIGPKGKVIYNVMPAIADFWESHNIPSNPNNLIIRAEVPAMGFSYFHVRQLNGKVKQQKKKKDKRNEKDKKSKSVFGFKDTRIKLNKNSGQLVEVTMNGITLPISQNLLYYQGTNGTNVDEDHRASGAYVFRPMPNTTALPISSKASITLYQKGPDVVEVHQKFASWAKQIIRIYRNESFVEFDWLVGPLPQMSSGLEIITRFTSNLKTDSTFYTDSNGRQMVKRVRNYRESFEYTNEEPISGNYFPVTSRIAVRDTERNVEMLLLNDRAQGGSSLKDGELELMLHRRLLNDDAFGVGEALMEDEFGHGVMVRGQTYLVLGKINADRPEEANSASLARDIAQKKLLAPWTFVGLPSFGEIDDLQSKMIFEKSLLSRELPANIQILTLEPWGDQTFLLRLENIFEKNEHPTLSQTTIVDIDGLFVRLSITEAYETTLGANQWIEENQKLHWTVNDDDVVSKVKENQRTASEEKINKRVAADLKKIELAPMEIRTFVCHYA